MTSSLCLITCHNNYLVLNSKGFLKNPTPYWHVLLFGLGPLILGKRFPRSSWHCHETLFKTQLDSLVTFCPSCWFLLLFGKDSKMGRFTHNSKKRLFGTAKKHYSEQQTKLPRTTSNITQNSKTDYSEQQQTQQQNILLRTTTNITQNSKKNYS